MTELHILVVDDEQAIRQVLAGQLAKAGHRVSHLGDGESALEALTRNDFDVCICDIHLPGISGIEVLKEARSQGVETVFLMFTAFASLQTAIEAMKEGAYDYLMKPVRVEDLFHRLAKLADVIRLRDENKYLKKIISRGELDYGVRSRSPAMRRVHDLADKVARSDSTVLITGESGTGKSFIARALHKASPRSSANFVSINCGAIPESLLESELFGHLKGSFTGADRNKKGLFREAEGGTIFLDEIFEMPLSLQVKLLHAIEEKAIRPVGAEQARKVDIRILAATNQDVKRAVAEGSFREDLYYRLNVVQIHIPPLRERKEDLPELARYFLETESRRLGLGREMMLAPGAEQALVDYSWPGNLRELQNVVARAIVLADGDEIRTSDLPAQILHVDESEPQGLLTAGQSGGTLRERVRDFEVRLIREAIASACGDRQVAARALGIGLSTLYRKLEEVAT